MNGNISKLLQAKPSQWRKQTNRHCELRGTSRKQSRKNKTLMLDYFGQSPRNDVPERKAIQKNKTYK